MKKFSAKILTSVVLIISTLFAVGLTPVLTSSVSAIEGQDFNSNLPLNDPTTSSDPLITNDPLTTNDTLTPQVNTPTDSTTDSNTNEPNDTDQSSTTDTTDPSETPDSETPDPDSTDESNPDGEEEATNTCSQEAGQLAWILCPMSNLLARGIDAIYGILIENFAAVSPLTMDNSSPIYLVWQYARNITNIIFVIFLLIVIYSQLTGLGINNYHIKRILPRLIVSILLVNLSFIICSLAVDLSNILGANLNDFFLSIRDNVMANSSVNGAVSMSELLMAVLGGGAVAGIAIGATGGLGAFFWMLVPILFGGLISVIAGLLTLSARQALVALLIMISPLAFVAYLLPNTETWFHKWKQLLTRMLVFYPLFSILFGASQLAGWAIISSASSVFGIILGVGVQIFPLFFSVSLMKMSGTVMGAFNAGLHRLATPLHRTGSNWALHHAERSRQHYIANANTAGSHLRAYLDHHRTLRDLDIKNSTSIRQNRALERAYHDLASSTGRDANGNDTTRRVANRYTRNAKRASTYELRAQTAELFHKNTVSAYNFDSAIDKSISHAGAQAYLDYSTQRYREANEAQSDQTWLLNQYLDAANHRDSYDFNRLIKNGAGSLKHLGEDSIMGQVIAKNVEIEDRRRREARVISNKFGMKKHKAELRGINLGFKVNDDGYAVDENGNVVEDAQYRLLPGKHRIAWDRFVAVDETTGDEIDCTEYVKLSAAEQARFTKKINYFDITNDKKQAVQRVHADDAGYMKELLLDDIAIADPINQRYMLSIGVNNRPDGQNGILRSYHSTMTNALHSTGYKEHDAATTMQLIAQLDNGYINSIGQLYIGKLESIKNATKPGPFLLNDAFFINQLSDIVSSVDDDDLFNRLFGELKEDGTWDLDSSFAYYRNVNGAPLAGAQWVPNDPNDASKGGEWKKIKKGDPVTPADQRNYLRHMLIPQVAQKAFGMMNRNPSTKVADEQKPATAEALDRLLTTLSQARENNLNPDLALDKKLDPNLDIFSGGDANAVKRRIDTMLHIARTKQQAQMESDEEIASSASSALEAVERAREYAARNCFETINQNITDIFDDNTFGGGIQAVANALVNYFENTEKLRGHLTELAQLLDQYMTGAGPSDSHDAVDQLVSGSADEEQRISELRAAIDQLLDDIFRD